MKNKGQTLHKEKEKLPWLPSEMYSTFTKLYQVNDNILMINILISNIATYNIGEVYCKFNGYKVRLVIVHATYFYSVWRSVEHRPHSRSALGLVCLVFCTEFIKKSLEIMMTWLKWVRAEWYKQKCRKDFELL